MTRWIRNNANACAINFSFVEASRHAEVNRTSELQESHESNMPTIFHITMREDWDRAKRSGSYEPPSLASEGFIHCSTSNQVVRTANRLFRGQMGLVLLEIDTDRVGAEIKYENCEGGEENFPHIYGALIPESVVRVMAFEPDEDGDFAMTAS